MAAPPEIKYWDHKPFWCRPWSILLFGNLVLLITWNSFHSFIIFTIAAFPVFVWWVLFLFVAPNIYKSE
tara:strand:- start:8482 stop:8688 length:207 start_codon:yes stop_codon:yes gene_type:complete